MFWIFGQCCWGLWKCGYPGWLHSWPGWYPDMCRDLGSWPGTRQCPGSQIMIMCTPPLSACLPLSPLTDYSGVICSADKRSHKSEIRTRLMDPGELSAYRGLSLSLCSVRALCNVLFSFVSVLINSLQVTLPLPSFYIVIGPQNNIENEQNNSMMIKF